MPTDELFDRTVNHLLRTADRIYGRGWRSEVDRQLEHSRGAIRKSLNRGTLRLRDFLKILEVLQTGPSAFFYEIEGHTTDTTLKLLRDIGLDRQGSVHPAVDRLFEGLDFNVGEPNFQTELLSKIRNTKNNEPEKALAATEATIELVKTGLLPLDLAFPLIVEWASCCRLLDRIEIALGCYLRAYRLAANLELQSVLTEILLGLPEVVARQTGDYKLALHLGEQACLHSMNLEDSFQTGRALLVRARFLFYLDKAEIAAKNLRLALIHIPGNQTKHLVAAHQNLAYVYKELGNLQSASHHLSIGIKLARDLFKPDFIAGLCWTKAELAVELNDFQTAVDSYLKARELFLKVSPISASLVSIDLAAYLVERGQFEEANSTIEGLGSLLQPLRSYPVVEAAVMELIRLTCSNKVLEHATLAAAAKRIRNESGQPLKAAPLAQD